MLRALSLRKRDTMGRVVRRAAATRSAVSGTCADIEAELAGLKVTLAKIGDDSRRSNKLRTAMDRTASDLMQRVTEIEQLHTTISNLKLQHADAQQKAIEEKDKLSAELHALSRNSESVESIQAKVALLTRDLEESRALQASHKADLKRLVSEKKEQTKRLLDEQRKGNQKDVALFNANSALETKIADLERNLGEERDRHKNLHIQAQNELRKAMYLTKRDLKFRANKIENLETAIRELKQKHTAALEENNKLNAELQALSRNLESVEIIKAKVARLTKELEKSRELQASHEADLARLISVSAATERKLRENEARAIKSTENAVKRMNKLEKEKADAETLLVKKIAQLEADQVSRDEAHKLELSALLATGSTETQTIQSLREKQKNYETELTSLQDTLKNSTAKLATLEEEHALSKETHTQDIAKLSESTKTQLERIKSALDSATKEVELLKLEKQELERTNNELQTQYQELQRDLLSSQTKAAEEMKRVQVELQEIKSRNNELQSQLEKCNTKANDKEAEMTTLIDKQRSLEMELKEKNEKTEKTEQYRATTKKELTEVARRLKSEKDQVTILRNRADALQHKLEESEKLKEECTSKLALAENRIEGLEKNLDTQVQGLNGSISKLETERYKAETSLSEKIARLEADQVSRDNTHNLELQRLQGEMETLSEKNKDDIQRLTEHTNALEGKLRSAVREQESTDKIISRTMASLDESIMNVSRLTRDLGYFTALCNGRQPKECAEYLEAQRDAETSRASNLEAKISQLEELNAEHSNDERSKRAKLEANLSQLTGELEDAKRTIASQIADITAASEKIESTLKSSTNAEKRATQLAAEKSSLSSRIEELNDKLSKHTRELKSLRGDGSKQTEAMMKLTKEAEEYKKTIHQLESQVEASEQQKSSLTEKHRASLAQLTQDIADSRNQAAEASKKIVQLQEGVSKEKKAKEAALEDATKKKGLLDSTSERAKTLSDEVSRMRLELLSVVKREQELVSNEKQLNALNKKLQEHALGVEQDLDRVKLEAEKNLKDALNAVTACESRNNDLRAKLDKCNADMRAFSNATKEKDANLEAVATELQTEKKHKTGLVEKAAELERKLTESVSEHESALAKVEELLHMNRSLSAEKNAIQGQLAQFTSLCNDGQGLSACLDDLTDMKSTFDSTITSAGNRRGRTKSNPGTLKAKLDSYVDDRVTQRTAILSESLQALTNTHKKTQSDLKRATVSLNTAQAANVAFSAKLDQHEDTIKEQDKTISNMSTNHSKSLLELMSLQANATQELRDTIQGLEDRINEKEATIKRLQSDLKENGTAIETLKESIAGAERELELSNEKGSFLDNQNRGLKGLVDSQKAEIAALQLQEYERAGAIDSMQRQIDESNKSLDRLRSELREQEKHVAELSELNAVLEEQVKRQVDTTELDGIIDNFVTRFIEFHTRRVNDLIPKVKDGIDRRLVEEKALLRTDHMTRMNAAYDELNGKLGKVAIAQNRKTELANIIDGHKFDQVRGVYSKVDADAKSKTKTIDQILKMLTNRIDKLKLIRNVISIIRIKQRADKGPLHAHDLRVLRWCARVSEEPDPQKSEEHRNPITMHVPGDPSNGSGEYIANLTPGAPPSGSLEEYIANLKPDNDSKSMSILISEIGYLLGEHAHATENETEDEHDEEPPNIQPDDARASVPPEEEHPNVQPDEEQTPQEEQKEEQIELPVSNFARIAASADSLVAMYNDVGHFKSDILDLNKRNEDTKTKDDGLNDDVYSAHIEFQSTLETDISGMLSSLAELGTVPKYLLICMLLITRLAEKAQDKDADSILAATKCFLKASQGTDSNPARSNNAATMKFISTRIEEATKTIDQGPLANLRHRIIEQISVSTNTTAPTSKEANVIVKSILSSLNDILLRIEGLKQALSKEVTKSRPSTPSVNRFGVFI
jgi:chromosome segregation ATPase